MLSVSLAIAMIWFLGRPSRNLPAIGPLLSPIQGLWNQPKSPYMPDAKKNSYFMQGLRSPVQVQVDKDQIKHVFAENDDDLYFAQGWILASERLWEMEFLARVAAGRLSEIVGEKALAVDKMFLKMGIGEAARESAVLIMQDPIVGPALLAYAKGVNAYIATVKDSDLPFEYRLLGVKPEAWSPEKAALLLKFMSYNLSGFSFDLPLTRSRAKLTKHEFDELFPVDLEIPEPVMPKGSTWPQRTQEIPRPPDKEFLADLRELDPLPENQVAPNPANGSNNWAIAGKKSTTGLPILSNDIHLGLSLPSLWYEMQLVSPTQNVYGVTLPGAPGVILGFNRKVAWGVTNGSTDVLDWYQLRYSDEKRSEYFFEGIFRPVISREVSIKVRGRAPVPLTLRRTHLGPIVYDESEAMLDRRIPKGLAMRWTGLDPSNEIKTFMLLNRASTVAECRSALEGYQNPIQNFLCADNAGAIGMWHMGSLPIRWRGQGRMISDGTRKDYEWSGWIPRGEAPFARNPGRGYLSSANQRPTDDAYPYFLGWWYENPFRGMRINELLREKSRFAPEDLVSMQMDTLSIPARTIVPVFTKQLAKQPGLDEFERGALEILKKWDFRFSENSSGAVIFHSWWSHLEKRLWSARFPDPVDYMYPKPQTTIELILDRPNSHWFDDPATQDKQEKFIDVARLALRNAVAELKLKLGTKDPLKWQWASFHPSEFEHVSKIPGLGSGQVFTAGVDWTVLANQGRHGPVWKMVVALGPKPRAWGIYPGGQSGNPTSPHYDDFIEGWRKGRLKELSYLTSAKEQGPRFMKSMRFEPEGKR